ncbi:MAG: hypothetical protein LBC02_13215, partial [Planctomycetaceae bacterium]|nr:hypothetical protein [Planctomycetaceae bacterium]
MTTRSSTSVKPKGEEQISCKSFAEKKLENKFPILPTSDSLLQFGRAPPPAAQLMCKFLGWDFLCF